MAENVTAPDPMIAPVVAGPKLLDQFMGAARTHGHNEEWAENSAGWCRRFILFHGRRHPKEMGLAEIAQFLEHVAATQKDALRVLEVARSALELLYAKVLHRFAIGDGDLGSRFGNAWRVARGT